MIPNGPIWIKKISLITLLLLLLKHMLYRSVEVSTLKVIHRSKLHTHAGYGAPSERSNRDEAMEFSDSRLWESYRRMFAVAGDDRKVSEAKKEPRR